MIAELTKKESITIKDLNEDLCTAAALFEYQLDSYTNLFTSYMNGKNKTTNEFNLENFLNTYSNKCAEVENINIKLLQEILKDEYKLFLTTKFKYKFNHLKRSLWIMKV